MATIEHVNKDGRDHYRLRFLLDKKRKTVGLGEFDLAAATIAKAHVEHLIGQHRRDRPPSDKTSIWLETLPAEVHDRLATLRLVEARKRCELPRTVLKFMREYITSRTDWKKPENHKQSVDHLETFLKGDVPLTALNQGECERFHRWMMTAKKGPSLSANTAGQHIKRCRQMMKEAMKHKLIAENPFEGIKIDLRSDASKDHEVTPADALAILEACPDQEWRTIFALARYAGLRCPSEVLKLRWSDIAWDRNRFKVRAPKTERYGKGERIVPLFKEVRIELEALRDLSEATSTDSNLDQYVIRRYRCSESNLRTTFGKICDRAGVNQFAKPFINCRTTRRNELERQGVRNAALNAWFGHSKQTAEKHYDRVTDDDFSDAIGLEGQLEGQSEGGLDASGPIRESKKPTKKPLSLLAEGVGSGIQYTPEDSNL